MLLLQKVTALNSKFGNRVRLHAPVYISSPKRLYGCPWGMARVCKIGYRNRHPCYVSPMSRLVRQLSTFLFVYLTLWNTKQKKKNLVLPSCSYVTLKHNITSPDVRCLSVNTHNFKTKTNGVSIVTAWEVCVSASAIKNYTKLKAAPFKYLLWHRSYGIKFFKRFHLNLSSFYKIQPEKNTEQNTHTHRQTDRQNNIRGMIFTGAY